MKKKGSLLAGLFLFVILMVGGTSQAADRYVPSQYPTIQSAITAAQMGDTVFVAAGTYNENIAMKSGINVVGNGPADTIIVGQAGLNTVEFDNVSCSVLKGFTITHASSSGTRSVEFSGLTDYSAVLQNCIIYGVQYGLFVWAPATPSIVNNTIAGKGSGEQGIYIGNEATGPQIINNIITGWQWGIHVYDESAPYSNDPNLEYNDVWGNTVAYMFGYGNPATNTPFTPIPDYVNYRNRGNISADPLFTNPATNDFTLQAGSPCSGTGFPNGEFQNPFVTTPGDGGFDMGAFGGGGNSLINIYMTGMGSVTSTGGTWLPSYPLSGVPNYQLGCPSSCTSYVPAPSICAPCSSYYTAGSEITLTAAADTGYYFSGWSGCGCVGTAACSKRYYAGYVTVSASFIINTYTVTAQTTGSGSISPSTQTVNYNETTSFTLTPAVGWHISSVIGCNGTLDGNIYTTGPITAGCTVEAFFAINTYTVTPTVTVWLPNPNFTTGFLNPSGPQTVTHGQTTSFTVTPYSDAWYTASVTGCGGSLSGNIYTTGAITGDCTVVATFAPCTYSVSPSTFTFGDSGGNASFTVTTNDPSCGWYLGFPGWIGINSDFGLGTSTVDFTVLANSLSSPRTGAIDIVPAASETPAASVTVNQDGCTFAINPYRAVLPTSGGTFTVSVISSNPACEWQAVSNDPSWLPITSPGPGGIIYFAEANNTGSKRTGTMTIAGLTFTVEQNDNSLQETLVVPPSGTWITATITNNTTETLITAKPTCCNTYFWVTDSQGAMVPPRDRICEPVGIPDSLVSILPGGSFEITCDLSEVANLPQEPITVMATYVNPLPFDPHYNGTGGCTADGIEMGRTECFDLKPVVIPSGVAQMSTRAGAAAQKTLAALAFNPQQWDLNWASANGPAISAKITSNTSGITCTNIDPASIMMNGQTSIIPGSCMNVTGGITVKFDRSAAVQSLKSLVAGTTASVTIQGSFTAGTDIFYGQGSVGIVKDTGTLVIQADMHTVGSGSKPSSVKTPLIGMETRAFDKKAGSCAAGFGMSWQNYASIWAQCTPAAAITTNSYGQAIFALSPGDYLVIGTYGSNIYPGVSVGAVDAGSIVDKYLQVIQTSAGQILPAKYQKFTGSELLVIEPEYVEWDGTQELYPFIFQSLGDWAVTTAVTPPEGFVADQSSLSVNVNTTLKAVQFTITDIGSRWVPTKVKHKIKHNGKTTYFYSKVGLKLSARLQKRLGLGEFGEKE